jgi:hypothetical protein
LPGTESKVFRIAFVPGLRDTSGVERHAGRRQRVALLAPDADLLFELGHGVVALLGRGGSRRIAGRTGGRGRKRRR